MLGLCSALPVCLVCARVCCQRGCLVLRGCFPAGQENSSEVCCICPCLPARLQNLGEAAPLLATPAAAKANAPQLQHLAVWAPLPLLDAIALAAGAAGHHPAVLAYVMRSLEVCRPEEVAFFLPQLVQASLGSSWD